MGIVIFLLLAIIVYVVCNNSEFLQMIIGGPLIIYILFRIGYWCATPVETLTKLSLWTVSAAFFYIIAAFLSYRLLIYVLDKLR